MNIPSFLFKKSFHEMLGIFTAIILIFLIWLKYPTFITSMDKPAPPQQVKIVIPFKVPEENTNDNKKSSFEKIGEKYGTYGDSYGSLNTLFSGLAFAMLIISVFMQRQELSAQRKELEAQRNEIKESNRIADAQRTISDQQKALNEQQIHDAKVQSFYIILFKYLEKKDRKLQDLTIGIPDDSICGVILLKRFNRRFLSNIKNTYSNDLHLLQESKNGVLERNIIDATNFAHKAVNNRLKENEYFEFIYFILNFINDHKNLNITDNAVKTFMGYQSNDEMYCMLLVGQENLELYKYIEKFSLLSRMSNFPENTVMNAIIRRLYNEKAYSFK